MATETSYLRAILPSLPDDLAKKVQALCVSSSESSAENTLDILIRFVTGAECASYATAETRSQWNGKQEATTKTLNKMIHGDEKRPREEDSETRSQPAKRQRLSDDPVLQNQADEQPVFTIHSVSATSPVRKKVDITIHQTLLTLYHPVTRAIEAKIPRTNLKRAFLVPTRGKTKAHWTIILLTSDTLDRSNNSSISSNTQIILGIDATASTPFSVTRHTETSTSPITTPKGSQTRPFILEFLDHLGIPILEPTPDIFKSACMGMSSGVSANEDGIPGVEAYRGTKVGSLWFMKEGILWGESKPCEFWPLEDLISKSEGVRVVGGTGRTCTVVLTRKSSEADVEGEEDMGIETEFSMVDSKEKSGIETWVRAFRNLFGKKKIAAPGNITSGRAEDDSDEEDETFELDSDEEHDGSTSLSGSSSDNDGGGDDDGGEEDAEESDNDGHGSEDELTEERHPLLRPGAMPRMNRAVINMVVGMVESDMVGTGNGSAIQDDGDEEDELDD